MTGKYMYDCYDKDEKPLGIFFEDGTKELLKHHPDVKYVRGMDAVTRLIFSYVIIMRKKTKMDIIRLVSRRFV